MQTVIRFMKGRLWEDTTRKENVKTIFNKNQDNVFFILSAT